MKQNNEEAGTNVLKWEKMCIAHCFNVVQYINLSVIRQRTNLQFTACFARVQYTGTQSFQCVCHYRISFWQLIAETENKNDLPCKKFSGRAQELRVWEWRLEQLLRVGGYLNVKRNPRKERREYVIWSSLLIAIITANLSISLLNLTLARQLWSLYHGQLNYFTNYQVRHDNR